MLPTMIAERQVVKKLDTLLCSQKGEEIQTSWLLPQKVHSHLIFSAYSIAALEATTTMKKKSLDPKQTNWLTNNMILFVAFGHQMQAVIK